MAKDKMIKFRVRERMKIQFAKVAKKKGVTVSELLTDFIKKTIE